MAIEFGPKLGLAVHADLNENWYDEQGRLLRAIDGLVQPSAISDSLNTPPGSPADGDVYIIGPAPTGVWSGNSRRVTRWSAKVNAWEIYAPRNGWLFYVDSLVGYLSMRDGEWVGFPAGEDPVDPEVPLGPTFDKLYFEGSFLNEAFRAMVNPEDTVAAAVGFPESTGKRYFEFFVEPLAAASTQVVVGFVTEDVLPRLADESAWGGYWFPGGVAGVFTWSSFGVVMLNGSSEGTITGFDDTTLIGFAVDLDARRVWPMVNGVAVTGDPVAGTGGFDIDSFDGVPIRPFVGTNGPGREITIIAEDGDINYPVVGFTPWYAP